ncbi:MAG: hypothetical protein ACYC8T_05580 [Myxococcaceae bacterium]
MAGDRELLSGPRERMALGQAAVWGLLSVLPLAHLTGSARVAEKRALPGLLGLAARRRGAEQRARHRREAWGFRSLGALMAVAGGSFVASALKRRVTPELRFLGQAGAAALAVLELAAILRGRLSRLHLVDVALELSLVAGWSLAGPPPPGKVAQAARAKAPPPVTRSPAEDLVTEASMESFPAGSPGSSRAT